MVNPDYAVAVWNDLIGATPVSDSKKARELLLRVQGRERSKGMPATSFEAAFVAEEEGPLPDATASEPVCEALPDNLHDLLAMFH
ncbi:MAG: hypothetical protein H7338_05940 [Candidatus Sericytochromatia bacterium]|nr:hypothetical protein [Candidatus Sericytochromatia bacterium]